MPADGGHLPPADKAKQRVSESVTNLKSKEDKLQKQILALTECKKGKVTVKELKDLGVHVDNLTNDNRTNQGKKIINAEIAELEKHLGLVREEVEAGQRVTNLESKVDKLQKQMTALVTLFNDKSAWDVNGDMKSTVTLPDVLTNLFMGTPTKSAMKKMHAELNVEKTSVNTQLGFAIKLRANVTEQQPFDLDVLAKMDTPLRTPSTEGMKTRIGRDGFNKVLVSTVKEIKPHAQMIMQHTRALVLACGSGVGKTFGTLTARQGFKEQDKEKKYNPVVAYIGFNCRSLMSDDERSFLKANPTEESIRVLLFSRLFAWLNAYKQLQKKADIDTKKSDVQKQFTLPTLTKELLRRVHWPTIKLKVTEILEQLAQEQPTLVLIIVVDEGQMLDEQCPDGARFALRYLRELQMLMGVRVRVLPVCTGIDPQTHLHDETEGKNISLSTQEEALLSQEEFRQLVSNAWKKVVSKKRTKRCKVFDDDIRLFAAFAWPRARLVMTIPSDKDFTIYPHSTTLVWEKGMDVRRVLQAAADCTHLKSGKVPVNMVRLVDQEGKQRPLIDYSLLHSIAIALQIPPEFVSLPDTVKLSDLHPDWHNFEAIAFQTLALFLSFFYHGRKNDNYLPTSANTKPLRKWFPLSARKVMRQKLGPGKGHPFHSTKSNERTALSDEFEKSLKNLDTHGDAILLHCGESAPLDFILVTLEKQKTKHTLQIRYADAKFKTDPINNGRYMTEKTRMLKKAKHVHLSLQALLDKPKNVEHLSNCSVAPWKDHDFLLITNSELKDDCVMSPETTTWEPMTTLLYSSTGEEEVTEVKVLPPATVLSSRPVWPALLSRGSHIPNHMWKTLLPPTRAMMTRHVPFFRRICKLI